MVGDQAVFADVDRVLEAEQVRHLLLRTFAQTHRIISREREIDGDRGPETGRRGPIRPQKTQRRSLLPRR